MKNLKASVNTEIHFNNTGTSYDCCMAMNVEEKLEIICYFKDKTIEDNGFMGNLPGEIAI